MTTQNFRGNNLVDSDDINQAVRDTIIARLMDELCIRCKNLDFEGFFRLSVKQLPPSGQYLANLGRLRNIQFSETCRVCALLSAVLPRTTSKKGRESNRAYHLRICPSTAAFRTWARRGPKSVSESVILAVVRGNGAAEVTREKICSSLFGGLLLLLPLHVMFFT
jgi:hypothetical protein